MPSDAQDLFAHPAQLQQPPPGSDPLWHLLRDAAQITPDDVGDIVQEKTSQEQHSGGAGLAAVGAFEYGKLSQPGWGPSSEVGGST